MASIGDLVVLGDGSIGVVGEEVPSPGSQVYRVYFNHEHVTVTDDGITATLTPMVFSVGDEITLWPYGGTIGAIDGDEFTLSVERQTAFCFGPITWTAVYRVPRWRMIRDNDTRINRL